MVGPWQVPVADAAVTLNSFNGFAGEAMAMGERSPVAISNHKLSGRLAVGEVVTNLASTDIAKLSDIKLSANWMASVDSPGQDQALFETVKDLGTEFCPALDLTIPVGKDSLFMKAQWQDESGQDRAVVSPLSLVVTGFAPVGDVRKSLTPYMSDISPDTALIHVRIGNGSLSLGGSILAQCFNQVGASDYEVSPDSLARFFSDVSELKSQQKILAYHDCSDGGLFTTLCEMAFASKSGLDIAIDSDDLLGCLFNESLGAVIQVHGSDVAEVVEKFEDATVVAHPNVDKDLIVKHKAEDVYKASVDSLHKVWSKVSYEMSSLRDNPDCAEEELGSLSPDDPGLSPVVSWSHSDSKFGSVMVNQSSPKVAVLREQGVNGHVEMAAAFDTAGFQTVDVHMSDLRSGDVKLSDFSGLGVAGGFSYGDVFGGGAGWGKSILLDESVRQQFAEFFERETTFSLGLCNGCQMFSVIKELIPGAEAWPSFVRNRSQQFEARLSMVEVLESPSVLLKEMQGSRLLVPLAHGEGRSLSDEGSPEPIGVARFVDNFGKPTEVYPANPNGSPNGLTGYTTSDGRATIMMPHPERAFRSAQLSWHPSEWGEKSPWFKMFANAFDWVKGQ